MLTVSNGRAVYGKWPFYRLGPIQEPFSVLMSFGNLYVNIKGILELRRRVRSENLLRRWLELAGWAQINTWIWSIIFHTRGRSSILTGSYPDNTLDKPFTERLDYFSATLTVATSLLYAVLRTFHLQTPQSTSRLAYPVTFALAILILSHFAYLLSFPSGSFPYGYHTKFVVFLALIHSGLWVLWTLSFHFQIPTLHVGTRSFTYPLPYPATDRGKLSTRNAYTPTVLVVLTTLAMSFELLDFPPIARVVDAHSVWHACTVPLAMAWWSFFCSDAIEFEGALLGIRGGGVGQSMDEKMPLTGSHSSPNMPSLSGQFTTTSLPSRPRSPSKEMKD